MMTASMRVGESSRFVVRSDLVRGREPEDLTYALELVSLERRERPAHLLSAREKASFVCGPRLGSWRRASVRARTATRPCLRPWSATRRLSKS
jgi:hypothetical protein